jgi:pseudouridine synthase
MGVQVYPDHDHVTVNGHPVPSHQEKITIALHKPVGVVSTCQTSRESGPPVTDLIDLPYRLYPAGRLDRDSSGLLILTNDGDLALTITHPRFGKEKEYRLRLKSPLTEKARQALQKGIILDNGPVQPSKIWTLPNDEVGIIVTEGRKRLIRRMFQTVGNRVTYLHRVRIGTIPLGDLKPGAWRFLSDNEVQSLQSSTNA